MDSRSRYRVSLMMAVSSGEKLMTILRSIHATLGATRRCCSAYCCAATPLLLLPPPAARLLRMKERLDADALADASERREDDDVSPEARGGPFAPPRLDWNDDDVDDADDEEVTVAPCPPERALSFTGCTAAVFSSCG